MMNITQCHHIAIAVRDIKSAKSFFQDVLGAKLVYEESDELDMRNSAFFALGGIYFELLEPSGPESIVARFLEKRGEGVFATAFKVKDYKKASQWLRAKGLRVVGEREEQARAFIHPKDTFGAMLGFGEFTWLNF
ncbi:MAG: VOC family protein [Chloroflexi bacterium]|nr:VOC family protein [Chloroflexota bacterium]